MDSISLILFSKYKARFSLTYKIISQKQVILITEPQKSSQSIGSFSYVF